MVNVKYKDNIIKNPIYQIIKDQLKIDYSYIEPNLESYYNNKSRYFSKSLNDFIETYNNYRQYNKYYETYENDTYYLYLKYINTITDSYNTIINFNIFVEFLIENNIIINNPNPIDIYNKMSPTLQLLTDRLDGKGLHSYDLVMDPLIEMRLCAKHANQCFEENLIYECIKSLRRRWFVAKKSLQFDYIDNNNIEDSISTETPNNIHLLLNYGRYLAEELIKFGFEGYAGAILSECVHIKGLDTVTIVGNICRYCEVQMCVHDLLISLKGNEEEK